MERLGGLRCVVVAGWVWAAAVLVAASGGVIDLIESLLLVFWGGLVSVLWVGASVAYDGEFRSRELRVWVSVPLVAVSALITAATPLPLAARMLMSAGALREYAEGHDPNPPHYLNAKWIGAFHVKKVWRHGTAVAFATDGQPFITRGVIYAPDGLPSAPLPMEVEELLWARYTHLYGAWYQFEMGD